jgi:hypothetical protein
MYLSCRRFDRFRKMTLYVRHNVTFASFVTSSCLTIILCMYNGVSQRVSGESASSHHREAKETHQVVVVVVSSNARFARFEMQVHDTRHFIPPFHGGTGKTHSQFSFVFDKKYFLRFSTRIRKELRIPRYRNPNHNNTWRCAISLPCLHRMGAL